jgi:putative endonuclease
MARRDTRTLGNVAEQLAFRYLRDRGLAPVARNFRCRHGEIDLVMLDDECLVFVEVRYRSPGSFASAVMTVDRKKQSKLVRTAEMFLATRRGFSSHRARFDVIGVDERRNGQQSVEWIRDAFHP